MERQILPLVPLLRSLLLTQGLGRVEVSTPPLVMRGPAVTNRRPRLCQPAPSNRRPHHRLSQAPRSFSAIWRIPSSSSISCSKSRCMCSSDSHSAGVCPIHVRKTPAGVARHTTSPSPPGASRASATPGGSGSAVRPVGPSPKRRALAGAQSTTSLTTQCVIQQTGPVRTTCKSVSRP